MAWFSDQVSGLLPELRVISDAWLEDRREAGGGNYQSLINSALRDYITHLEQPLEDTLRKVIREELKNAS